MARRHYSDRDRAAALAVYDSTADQAHRLRDAARQFGVPVTTLRGWLADRDRAAPADLRRAAVIDLEAVAARMGIARRPRSRSGPRATKAKGEPCVYLVGCDGFFKIGLSTNLPGRLCAMQSGSPHDIVVDLVVSVPDRDAAYELEQAIHAQVWHCHHRGEWFVLDDDALAIVRRMMREAYEQATA